MPSEPREPADRRAGEPRLPTLRGLIGLGSPRSRSTGRPLVSAEQAGLHCPRSFCSFGVISSSAALAVSWLSLKTLLSSSSRRAPLNSLKPLNDGLRCAYAVSY